MPLRQLASIKIRTSVVVLACGLLILAMSIISLYIGIWIDLKIALSAAVTIAIGLGVIAWAFFLNEDGH